MIPTCPNTVLHLVARLSAVGVCLECHGTDALFGRPGHRGLLLVLPHASVVLRLLCRGLPQAAVRRLAQRLRTAGYSFDASLRLPGDRGLAGPAQVVSVGILVGHH